MTKNDELKGVMVNQFTKIIEKMLEVENNEEHEFSNFYTRIAELNLDGAPVTGNIEKDIEELRKKYYTTNYDSREFETYSAIEEAITEYKSQKDAVENMLKESKDAIQKNIEILKKQIEENQTKIEKLQAEKDKIKSEKGLKSEERELLTKEEIDELDFDIKLLENSNENSQSKVDIMEQFLNQYGSLEALGKLIDEKNKKEEAREERIEKYQYQRYAGKKTEENIRAIKKEKYGYFDEYFSQTETEKTVENKQTEEQQVEEQPVPGFKPASDLEEKETTEQETGFRRAGDLDKEEKPEKEVKTPEFRPASDLEEKETTEQETGFRRAGDLDKEEKSEKEVKTPEFRPASDLEEKETTEQETGFRRAGDLDKEVKSQKEVKTPGFKPASDLEVKATAVKATAVKATAFTRAGNLGEEDKLEKTTPEFEPASDLEAKEKTEEHPKVKSLNKIIIRIGENGKSITTIEREGETPDVGEGLELWALDSKITECAKIAPEADKWVGREIWRNNTAGLLSKEEMKEQYSIYLDIMRGKNIEENKKKLKIDLKYDLTGLRGLNRNIKKEIKANAKKAKRIGIAEVETRYSKFVNVVWNLASDAVAKVKGVFTKALPEPENTTRTNTSEEASYEDKVLADLDNKGAFDHSYEYKPTEKTTTKVSKRSMSESSKKSKTPKEFRNEMSYGDKLIENYDSRGAFNHSYKSKSEQENEEIVK